MKRAHFRVGAAVAALALVAIGCSEDDPLTQVGAEPTEEAVADESTAADEIDEDMAMADDSQTGEADQADDHDHTDHADEHDESMATEHNDEADHDSHDSHHDTHEVSGTAPTVSVEVVPDPSAGINVHITTTDFMVAPHSASTEHVDGEGHFHLYVDGEKRLRFYNESIHVDGIPEGEVTIEVELSGNDHGAYSVDGVPISDAVTLTVPPHEHSVHDHGEPEPHEWVGSAPTLDITVHDDPDSGWNAFVDLDGFELSGENASGDHVEGEGNIQLFVDDLEIMRLYGFAAHLSTLPPGEHEISVGLYTNDHRPYVIDGDPIEATTTVTVES